MESGVGPAVELNSLDDRIRIRDAIQKGRIQEATALINQLHPEMLDNDRYLYFHLQVIIYFVHTYYAVVFLKFISTLFIASKLYNVYLQLLCYLQQHFFFSNYIL